MAMIMDMDSMGISLSQFKCIARVGNMCFFSFAYNYNITYPPSTPWKTVSGLVKWFTSTVTLLKVCLIFQ